MRKPMKKTLAMIMVGTLCITSVVTVSTDAKVKKPKLNLKKISLNMKQKKKLQLKNTANVKKVTWKSSNNSVAFLTKKKKKSAVVVAKKQGKATITCQIKAGKKTYKSTCKVTVKKVSKPVATTAAESQQPEASPSDGNIGVATVSPTNSSTNPSGSPLATDPQPTDAGVASQEPSVGPTKVPPTEEPSTAVPTETPAVLPTETPAVSPTETPKATAAPTATAEQTNSPATGVPTAAPSTTVPTKEPTATPNSSQEPTAIPSKVSLDLTSGTYINSEAYTRQWAGNAYNIGALITAQGYQIGDFTKATVVIELLDENKKVIENEGYGALKLSTKNSDWAGFTDDYGIKSGVESKLSMEEYPSDTTDLYLVVQNSSETVKYIRVVSIEMETNPSLLPTATPTIIPIESPTPTPTASPTSSPTSSPTATPTVPAQVDLNIDPANYINASAYTRAWSGTVYNLGPVVTAAGYNFLDFTDVKITVNLLDENKDVIEDLGGASVKLSTSNGDWAGFTDVNGVQSGKEFGLELETYPSDATDLYIVVQNSTADVKYIQITSIIMENNGKKDATEVITNYESLAALAENAGFRFGTNISSTSINKTELTKLIQYHFNSTTFSNEMKAYSLLKQAKSQENYENKNSPAYIDFTTADKMVKYAQDNGLSIRGHVLVWDADMCDWFFREGYTTYGDYVSADVMKKRMQMYIEEVMTHFETEYPGVIYCWDVVNEAVADNTGEFAEDDARHVRQVRGEDRKPNLFYDHIGSDYVELAFKYAYETRKTLQAANSKTNIKLFYNDYNTFMTYGANKRDAIIELVKRINSYVSDGDGDYLKLCDGIGMQSYIGGYGLQSGCMNESDITAIKTAIEKFADLGVEVHVTELAVRNYEDTAARETEHAAFYKKLMQTYVNINKTAQENGKTGPLTSVSIWGLFDNPNLAETDYSYKMNGPYCGLFTELYEPKEAFKEVYKVLAGE